MNKFSVRTDSFKSLYLLAAILISDSKGMKPMYRCIYRLVISCQYVL